MTLFITAARAAAVSSFRGAQNSLRKSTHRILTETLLLGVVAGGVVSLVRWVIFRELMTRGHAIGATVFLLVYLGVIIAVMTTLAAFILYKTGRCRCCRGVDDDDDGGGNFIFSSSSSIEQFSNLVASVAIVYCLCQIPFIIDYFTSLFLKNQGRIKTLAILTNFMIMANSTFNLFIYLAFSRSFKRAFVNFCTRFRCESSQSNDS